jgi:tetratricopeptide (TPR) repeat protein
MTRLAITLLCCASACRAAPRDVDPCTNASSCLARFWDSLGDVQLSQGDDVAAVTSYRRAFDHRAPDDLHGRTLDARGLYRSYIVSNHYESAMHYAAIAYTTSAKLEDRELRGRVLVGVLTLLVDMGDLPAAEAVLREAESVVDPSTDVGLTMREMGAAIELAHGRARIAVHELQEVQAQASRHEDRLLVDTTLDLVEAALEAGELDLAEQTLAGYPAMLRTPGEPSQMYADESARLLVARGRNDEAIATTSSALKADPGDLRAEIEGTRGRALMRSGHLAQAETSLWAAIEATEALRDETTLDAFKPGVMEQLREPFEDLFRLYVDQGRVVDALEVVQRATARSLYDGLASVRSDGGPIAKQIDLAGDRATGLVALAHSLRASGSARPPDGATLVARLKGRHVLTYFRAGGDIWVIAIRASAPPIARRIGAVEVVRAKIDAWLAAPDQLANAKDLAQLLLPADVRPAPGITLYVAADEPVREVSFAALPVDAGYLVDKNPIAYAPSASLPAPPRLADAAPAIVLGDPTGDLPAARREAIDVAAAVGGEVFVGAEATRQRVVSRARVLHIAGHTELTPRGPALSLADGHLDSGEIIDQRLSADVVVLSSCATANPRDRDELAPVANAFLAAGAGAVVATRWAVEDAVARRFARTFYAAGGATHPVAATAAAQRQLIADNVAAQQWATFVVLQTPSR